MILCRLLSVLCLLPAVSLAFLLQRSPGMICRKVYSSETPGETESSSSDDSVLNELSWRVAKIRLEEANTRSFLKRRPVKLPYLDARRWVQANLGAETEHEFRDLVVNGNLRTPYIPKNPKEYYESTGDWISWEHFLTGFFEEKACGISPPTGKFD